GATTKFIEDHFPRKDREQGEVTDPEEDLTDRIFRPASPLPSKKDDQDHDDDDQHDLERVLSPPDIDQPLQRSKREKRIPNKPGNVYGDRNPTDIQKDLERDQYWNDTVEKPKDSNQGPSQ